MIMEIAANSSSLLSRWSESLARLSLVIVHSQQFQPSSIGCKMPLGSTPFSAMIDSSFTAVCCYWMVFQRFLYN
ncbi:hypothetical protein Csa_005379 [Cucumis sativus]|uniref:Uncharacterized protein n=1 Tax=Cucumis sativus TaxID=3659 RepID=A0A0A0KB48_CUCSA|nr:hypothetical protein Csa_005379 [Cucumis sativus]